MKKLEEKPPQNSFSAEDAFVRQQFQGYYSVHAKSMPLPPAVQSREFGAGLEKKIDYRHKSFSGERELQEFLSKEAPFYVSYSTARYSFPSARPMEKKVFQGADIAFDLDKPMRPQPHEHDPLFCPACLESTRQDAVLFAEQFLFGDFGFSQKDVLINYSGSKGFHFHVRAEPVQQLSSAARKELCDYSAAYGVSTEFLFKKEIFGGKKDDYVLHGPSLSAGGWKARVCSAARDLLSTSDEKSLRELGLTPKKASLLVAQKGGVLEKLTEGIWSAPSGEGFEQFYTSLAQSIVSKLRVELDAPVTFDLARLIRLPQTLHGDTGFVAKALSRGELEKFSPLADALVFRQGQLTVSPLGQGQTEFLGEKFSLQPGQALQVPLGLAVLLLRKRRATLA